MSTLHMDHIEGRPRSEYDSEGWVYIERCARVTDVGGTGTKKHLNALKVSGMPSIGDIHPSIADMEVTRYRFDTKSDRTVDVYPIYERRDAADNSDYFHISGESYITQVETNRDSNGDLIEVEYAGKKQSGTIMEDLVGLRLIVRRRESAVPDDLSDTYVGTYNSGTWSIAGVDVTGGAGVWKCASYTWDSADNGKVWDSVIVFEKAPRRPDNTQTWAQEVTYLDPETGRIPDGVIDGSAAVQALAIKSIAAGPLVDFGGLGL